MSMYFILTEINRHGKQEKYFLIKGHRNYKFTIIGVIVISHQFRAGARFNLALFQTV